MGHQSPSSILSRSEGVEPLRSLICIATEGRCTEPSYIDNLVNMLKPNIECIYIEKKGIDEDNTRRRDLIMLALAEVRTKAGGKVHPFLLLTMVINQFYSQYPETKQKIEKLWEIRKSLFTSKENAHSCSNDALIKECCEKLKRSFRGHPFEFEYTDDSFDQNIDSRDIYAYAMYDRDMLSDNNSNGFYKENLQLAKKNNVSLLVTNPNFELWLLLHHPGLNYDEIDQLSAKDGFKKKILALEEKTTTFKNFKHISRERFDTYYRDHIADAIDAINRNPGIFCKKLDDLETQRGSNVGDFLERIVNPHYLSR